jgi:hypothetical protein
MRMPLLELDEFQETKEESKIEDLDGFLREIYDYFQGKGFCCIVFCHVLSLLTLAFVVLFSTFLMSCVDYTDLFENHNIHTAVKLEQFRYLHPIITIYIVVLSFAWVWQLVFTISSIKRLNEIRKFYHEKLSIKDDEIQTVRWNTVMKRLIECNRREIFFEKREINEYDIVNRIMRRENYMIGMFNKEVLKIEVSFGWFGKRIFLPKSLEWNIRKYVVDAVFDTSYIREEYYREDMLPDLAKQLKKRLIWIGICNLVLCPFIMFFYIMYFFFRYADEFRRQPTSIGLRRWSSYAKWRLREFNELDHIYKDRLNKSYKLSNEYISGFSNPLMTLLARFTTFFTGAIVSVFMLLGIYDEQILYMDLTHDRTILWYIGLLSIILMMSRSMNPDENKVFDPEETMKGIVKYTHHYPEEWNGKVHTYTVYSEFSELFTYNITLVLEEMFTLIITPLILIFILPSSSFDVVSFFYHFTTREESGDVCSFATFNLKKHGNSKYGVPEEDSVPEERLQSSNGKLERSFLNFKQNNPDWKPTQSGQRYISSIQENEDSCMFLERGMMSCLRDLEN